MKPLKKQLAAIRERDKGRENEYLRRFSRKSKRLSDSKIKRIVEHRAFAYIDLYLWSLIQKKPFTNNQMAAMIYPIKDGLPSDVDVVDRVARTVKRTALTLLQTNRWLLL